MDMVVVPVIVTMAVRVRHGLVRVLVLMPCGQHEIESGGDARYGRELRRLNALVEQRPGDDDAEKGRRGEEQLRSRCSEMLCAEDVEHDRAAVADRTDCEGRADLSSTGEMLPKRESE